KTFLDDFLLNADLTRYLEPWQYDRLNVVEKALLGKKHPGEAEAAARYLREIWELLPHNPQQQDRWFGAALLGRSMSQSDFSDIQRKLQEQPGMVAQQVAPAAAPAEPAALLAASGLKDEAAVIPGLEVMSKAAGKPVALGEEAEVARIGRAH